MKQIDKTQEEILNQVIGMFGDVKFTSQLYKMFGENDDAVKKYIKPGREFWHYDAEKRKYRKLKVVYIRTGVMFFVFEDEPEVEQAWFTGSLNCLWLHAAQIFPYEIGKILLETGSIFHENADKEFPKICETCKWDDCDGRITVEVIWDKTE